MASRKGAHINNTANNTTNTGSVSTGSVSLSKLLALLNSLEHSLYISKTLNSIPYRPVDPQKQKVLHSLKADYSRVKSDCLNRTSDTTIQSNYINNLQATFIGNDLPSNLPSNLPSRTSRPLTLKPSSILTFITSLNSYLAKILSPSSSNLSSLTTSLNTGIPFDVESLNLILLTRNLAKLLNVVRYNYGRIFIGCSNITYKPPPPSIKTVTLPVELRDYVEYSRRCILRILTVKDPVKSYVLNLIHTFKKLTKETKNLEHLSGAEGEKRRLGEEWKECLKGLRFVWGCVGGRVRFLEK